METIVTVELTSEDAELFKKFQNWYLAMKTLQAANAFSIKNGSVTLNFNAGEILTVDVRNTLKVFNT